MEENRIIGDRIMMEAPWMGENSCGN